MIAFCDFHHGGMYKAMHMLFHDRLGYDVYRPVGYEWLDGYWYVSDLQPTQKAYLEPGGEHWMGDDGFWRWRDNGEKLIHKCMTFQQFRDMDVELIIQTHPVHELCYRDLRDKHKPKAKVVRVIGNTGEVIHAGPHSNIMDSTGYHKGRAENYVHFHQEFPLNSFDSNAPPPKEPTISQYLNFFRDTSYFRRHWEAYRPLLPEFQWKMHGHQGDDGFLFPLPKIAKAMGASTFVWHIKQEGYGHIIHNAFAAARPVITHIKNYEGYTAGTMLEDGETCVDIAEGRIEDNVAKIRRYAQPEEHLRLCANIKERFKRLVSFDAEEMEIRKFMERLI